MCPSRRQIEDSVGKEPEHSSPTDQEDVKFNCGLDWTFVTQVDTSVWVADKQWTMPSNSTYGVYSVYIRTGTKKSTMALLSIEPVLILLFV